MLINDFQDTPLGPLPKEWNVTFLKSVVEKTEKRDPRKKPNKSFRYIDVSSVSNKTYRVIGWTELVGQKAPSRARKVVKSKDTIFATVRPYLKNIGQIPEHLDDEICSTGYCVIRANRQLLDPDFLYFIVLSDSFVENIVSQQRGSSYPAVSDKVVLDTLIPLPPLPEQRAIAHVLTTVRNAIEATERVIAAASELKRSMMKHLFTYGPVPIDQADQVPLKETEIGEMPEEWEVIELSELVTKKITDGTHKTPTYVDDGIPFITAKDIGRGWVDFSDCKFITPEEHKELCRRVNPELDDILLSKVGTLGNVAQVDVDIDFSIFVQLALIKPDKKVVNPHYLKHALRLSGVQDEIIRTSSQSTMKYIGVGKIAQLHIPHPSRNEQESILYILEMLDDKLSSETQRKTALDALFNSLLHHLMTGKVRVNKLNIYTNTEGKS